MRKNSIDTVLRLKLKHKPGRLARLATGLAEQDAVLGEITTLRIGEEDSLREITIETADGRSINNNALAFPGLFKGALEVRSRAIAPEMMVAAAQAIADHTDAGAIVPSPLQPEVQDAVRRAAAETARMLGLAQGSSHSAN